MSAATRDEQPADTEDSQCEGARLGSGGAIADREARAVEARGGAREARGPLETGGSAERRVEELDPVDITVPDEEIIDPKKIEPIGNYGNNENPSNVDGADPQSDSDYIDDSQAGDDEDTPHPITPQTR